MTRRRKQTDVEALEPPTLEPTTLVPPVRPAAPVASPRTTHAPPHRAVRVNAATAASLSPAFPAGAEAFDIWCRAQGIDTQVKRSLDQWEALLDEFANRPLFGLRRSQNGTHAAKR
jgi:hypothetical protein